MEVYVLYINVIEFKKMKPSNAQTDPADDHKHYTVPVVHDYVGVPGETTTTYSNTQPYEPATNTSAINAQNEASSNVVYDQQPSQTTHVYNKPYDGQQSTVYIQQQPPQRVVVTVPYTEQTTTVVQSFGQRYFFS